MVGSSVVNVKCTCIANIVLPVVNLDVLGIEKEYSRWQHCDVKIFGIYFNFVKIDEKYFGHFGKKWGGLHQLEESKHTNKGASRYHLNADSPSLSRIAALQQDLL